MQNTFSLQWSEIALVISSDRKFAMHIWKSKGGKMEQSLLLKVTWLTAFHGESKFAGLHASPHTQEKQVKLNEDLC